MYLFSKVLIFAGMLLLIPAQAKATKFTDSTAGACALNTYRITQRDCAGSGTGHQSYATITTLIAAMSASETAYIRTGTYTAGITNTLPSG